MEYESRSTYSKHSEDIEMPGASAHLVRQVLAVSCLSYSVTYAVVCMVRVFLCCKKRNVAQMNLAAREPRRNRKPAENWFLTGFISSDSPLSRGFNWTNTGVVWIVDQAKENMGVLFTPCYSSKPHSFFDRVVLFARNKSLPWGYSKQRSIATKLLR